MAEQTYFPASNSAGVLIHTVYTAIVTINTDFTVSASVLQNTTGVTVTWSADSAGVYIGAALNNSFPEDKTFLYPHERNGKFYIPVVELGILLGYFTMRMDGDSNIHIETFDTSFILADLDITEDLHIPVEVRIYP